MESNIKKLLSQETPPDGIEQLRRRCVRLLKMSRTSMADYYEEWDRNLSAYQREYNADNDEDFIDETLERPRALTVPMTYAQIQTFCAFVFSLYNLGSSLFTYGSTGREDKKLEEVIQKLMERDQRKNKMLCLLYQGLLNIARMNLVVTKVRWKTQKAMVKKSSPEVETDELTGMVIAGEVQKSDWVSKLVYEGNEVVHVNPYNFFPDTRKEPLKWGDGEFMADEYEFSLRELKELEKEGGAAGVKWVEQIGTEMWDKRKSHIRLPRVAQWMEDGDRDDKDFMCWVSCMQLKINPKKYGLNSNMDFTVDAIVQIVNDSRIISIDFPNAMHCGWVYDYGMFSPDDMAGLSDSLASAVDPMQELVSFLINSRALAVKRGLQDKLVVDMQAVDMNTLEHTSGFIGVHKTLGRFGVDTYVRQLSFNDKTAQHFSDANTVVGMIQTTTGVNENMQGQYSGGRRSSYESRATNAGSTGRLKMTAATLWEMWLGPLAEKMLVNLRQELSQESFRKVLGDRVKEGLEEVPVDMATGEAVVGAGLWEMFHPSDPTELVGSEDVFVYNSTTEVDRIYLAQALQELLLGIATDPQVATMMNVNFKKLLDYILVLKGVDDPAQFSLDYGIKTGDTDAVRQLQLVQSLQAQASPGEPGAQGGSEPVQ